jgi:putative peptide zinc metalloprotease protein
MQHTAPETDLERRKSVRLRLRADLGIDPQKYEGRTYWVVKDPVSMRYYRFKEQEHFLLQFMDGEHTLDEAQKEYENRFRPERLKLEDLEHFAQQLLVAGLAQNESPRAGKQLFDRRKKRKRSEWMQTLTNILYIKIPIIDPDKILTRMMPYCGWVFSPLALILAHAYFLATLIFVGLHFETFRANLPSYQSFFTLNNLAYMWVALGVVKVIHEFGHGLSCRKYGGEVHEMGALFLCFSPCLYCNVSDAWTLPSKWKRIVISYAGIYVELFIAATSTFIWWNTASSPFINNLSLCLMVVCSVSTVVFNANPLMRYDGYYVLADWLEIPNLRDRANRFLKNTVLEHCLGVEVQPEPYMATSRKVLFMIFAIVSWVYRWVVTYSILMFMATFLKPYKLEVVSKMLAVASLASMVGWPLWRLGKNLYRRGRLPDMKSGRIVMCGVVVGMLLLAFFLVPLPVSRIRQVGLVQLQEDAGHPVLVKVPGQLQELNVTDGSKVRKGDVLAVLFDRDLERQIRETEAHLKSREEQRDLLEMQLEEARKKPDSPLVPRIDKNLKECIADLEIKLPRQWKILHEREQELTLVAPADGWVINPPSRDEISKQFDPSQPQAFCTVGDPARLRILVPVRPSEYQLLKEEQAELKAQGKGPEDLKITIRVQGHDHHTWEGELMPLPESEMKVVPPPLSNKMNGPIAVKPTSEKNQLLPQAQYYLVSVELKTDDPAVSPDTLLYPRSSIAPGSMAQVKIHCRWRSAAWWVWRTVNETFDLGAL